MLFVAGTCYAYLKARWTNLEKTGLLFAGYGNGEFFPCLEQYECWGVVMGAVVHKRLDGECKSIDFEIGSEIVAVAQDEADGCLVPRGR